MCSYIALILLFSKASFYLYSSELGLVLVRIAFESLCNPRASPRQMHYFLKKIKKMVFIFSCKGFRGNHGEFQCKRTFGRWGKYVLISNLYKWCIILQYDQFHKYMVVKVYECLVNIKCLNIRIWTKLWQGILTILICEFEVGSLLD